jgi:hypothetical protein
MGGHVNKLTTEDMARNIAHVYSLATEKERSDGRAWYPTANGIMREWSRTYGRTVANVAALTAALSPQLRWEINLIAAADVLAGATDPSQPVIGANWRKARRIADERLESVLNKYPYGPKVTSFAANLAGDYSAVTVDTHASQIALGSPTANGRLNTFKDYAPYVAAYTLAASHLNLNPSELQAITWLTWKRMYPAADKRTLRRAW